MSEAAETPRRAGKAKSAGEKRRARRAGRSRKAGEREPNGRLVRSDQPREDVRLVVLRQRARSVGMDLASSQKAETALGILCLLGRLGKDGAPRGEQADWNEAAYLAGVWWGGTVCALRRMLGSPSPNPASPAWEMVARGSLSGADEGDDEDELRARKERLLKAIDRGRVIFGPALKEVEALVVYDYVPVNLEAARCGLLALAVDLGLTNHIGRSKDVTNAA